MVHDGVTEEGNRRDFLGQDFFFFTVLTLLMKRIIPMDLARPPEKSGMTSGPIRVTKLWRFKYFTFCRRGFYSLGLNCGLDELSVMNVCILDRDSLTWPPALLLLRSFKSRKSSMITIVCDLVVKRLPTRQNNIVFERENRSVRLTPAVRFRGLSSEIKACIYLLSARIRYSFYESLKFCPSLNIKKIAVLTHLTEFHRVLNNYVSIF